ncbi:MAG: hypothetical protein FJ271_32560 [Planctomycetes bacterium]|nr:hypothetical protein [Planctomycetota bacterium]
MRKWIWSGTALMVFSCAAMYLAAQHAAEHPNSVTARFFRGASTVGMRCNPLLAIGQATLPEPPRPSDKPNCQPLCILPNPEVMAREQPLIALPGIGEATEVLESPEVSEPIVVESAPPPPESLQQPPTVEPYDSPEYPQQAFSDEYEQPVAAAASGDDEENLPQPSVEPYGYENSDEEGPSMPYVSDDADEFEDVCTGDIVDACDGACGSCRDCGECGSRPCLKMGCCSSCGMLRIIKVMCCGEECPECARCTRTLGEIVADYLNQVACQEEAVCEEATENVSDQPEDAPASEAVDTPPDAEMPPSDESPTNLVESQEPGVGSQQYPAREDPHYHHHYPSCPYTGHCPYPYHYNIPRVDPVQRRSNETQPTQPAETHAEEQQAPPEPMPPVKPVKKKKKLFFLLIGEAVSDCACQPGVDTMECRPSDLHGKVRSPF